MVRIKTKYVITIVFISLLLIPCLSVVIYDLLIFQPKLAEMRGYLQQAPIEDQQPPQLVKKLILIQSKGNLANYVMRIWTVKLNLFSTQSHLQRQFREMIWIKLINFHLSVDEQLAFYSAFSYNGYHYGLAELSNKLFNKSLSQLSAAETADIISIIQAPTTLHNKSKRTQLRDNLLKQLKF